MPVGVAGCYCTPSTASPDERQVQTMNIQPCRRHYQAILGPHALEWHRALQVADDCALCEVTA